MTDKEFVRNLMMSRYFYHEKYGKVMICSLPNANGEVNASPLNPIGPSVVVNIRDLTSDIIYSDMNRFPFSKYK